MPRLKALNPPEAFPVSSPTIPAEASEDPARTPSLAELVGVWARIGFVSFGGASAQIALMHRVVVDEKKWLSERQYLNALGFCMLLPGPEAMQLATYTGWRVHGTLGGLLAGLLFVLPGAFIVLALTAIYAAFGEVTFIEAIFFGIKAAVLVIVIDALLKISTRALKSRLHWIIAALSFVAIFFFAQPFPLIVLIAAIVGFFGLKSAAPNPDAAAPALQKGGKTLRTAALWLSVWILPLAAVAAIFGSDHLYAQIGWFFSKLAVVTFGGAYAVLAYMAQDAVVNYGWLNAEQMMDGLGLAETTPGPTILVVEFVGFMAAWRDAGESALASGMFGAAIALWATFAPCFLWIFAGAPYVEWINGQPRLRGALSGITAAVVGVILNLALWFALHVLFREVALTEAGPFTLWIPDPGSLDWRVLIPAAASAAALLYMRWGVIAVLSVASAAALVIKFAGL